MSSGPEIHWKPAGAGLVGEPGVGIVSSDMYVAGLSVPAGSVFGIASNTAPTAALTRR
jgi:hypothetical protein